MARQDFEHRRLYYKYFVPYALLVLALVAMVSIWFGVQAVRNANTEYDNQRSSSLQVISTFFENQFAEMDRMAYYIETSQQYMPYSLLPSTYSRNLISEELKSLVSSNSYISNIAFIYSRDVVDRYSVSQQFYSTYGPLDVKTFWTKIYGFSNLTLDEFYSDYIDTTEPRCIYPLYSTSFANKQTHIMYILPMKVDVDGVNRRGVIIFLLKPDAINDFVEPLLKSGNYALKVHNQNGDLIYNISFSSEQEDDKDLYDSGHTSVFDSEYSLVLETELRKLTVELYWHEDFLTHIGINFMSIPLMTFALFLVVGLLCAMGLSTINYRPLSEAFNSVSALRQPLEVSIQGMANSIKELHTSWDKLNNQILKQREYFYKQVIFNILEGKADDSLQFNQQLQDTNIDIIADKYAALIMHITPGAVDIDKCKYLDILAKALEVMNIEQPTIRTYALCINDRSIAALICMRTDTDIHEIQQRTLNNVIKNINIQFNIDIAAGIGSVVYSIKDIHKSYQEAQMSLECEFLYGSNNVYFYKDVLANSYDGELMRYPLKDEQRLLLAIEMGDFQNVSEAIDDLVNLLQKTQPPVHAARSICLSIISRIRVRASESCIALNVKQIEQLDKAIVEGNCTLYDFKNVLNHQLQDVCKQIEARHESREAVICHEIDAYLEREYSVCTLSLTEVANHFGKSSGHLARIYKQTTGNTIMAKLDEIRLQHSCELLKETTAPLDEIIESCGYTDKSNFVRKFKQKYQITPIRYRELLSNNDTDV